MSEHVIARVQTPSGIPLEPVCLVGRTGPADAVRLRLRRRAEMLRLHVRRRLSEQLDGITHGPQGSRDKLLMTWVEQSVGHAALAVAGTGDEAQRILGLGG